MIKFEHTLFALPFALAAAAIAARGHGLSIARVAGIVVAMAGARTAAMGFNRHRRPPHRRAQPAHRRARIADRRDLAARRLGADDHGVDRVPGRRRRPRPALPGARAGRARDPARLLADQALHRPLPPVPRPRHRGRPAGAWIAVRGDFGWAPGLLMLAVGCWIAGFDILYALPTATSIAPAGCIRSRGAFRDGRSPRPFGRAARRDPGAARRSAVRLPCRPRVDLLCGRRRLRPPPRLPARDRAAGRPFPPECRLLHRQRGADPVAPAPAGPPPTLPSSVNCRDSYDQRQPAPARPPGGPLQAAHRRAAWKSDPRPGAQLDPRPLGELWIDAGWITRAQLDKLLAVQREVVAKQSAQVAAPMARASDAPR